jgi:hypothetical protein
MTSVFSKNKPILAFNNLTDRTEQDEQEGMIHLFMGAVLALRNPRSHALLVDSPEHALEYIAFLSPPTLGAIQSVVHKPIPRTLIVAQVSLEQINTLDTLS